MNPCDNFREGSRKWKICKGLTDLSPEKVNRYRESWGIPPLYAVADERMHFDDDIHFEEFGVSEESREFMPSYGPGTELIRYFEDKGIPSCDACKDLALEMNKWGCDGCNEKLDYIVDDILPRAKDWIRTGYSWALKVFPGTVTDAILRSQIATSVKNAINKARDVIENAKDVPQHPSSMLMAYSLKKRKRCGSCGGSRKKTVMSPVTNLILDTTNSGNNLSQDDTEGPFRKSLSYHIYPRGDWWKWNVDQMMERIDMFDGRRVIAIAVDDSTDSYQDVISYIGDRVSEYLVYENIRSMGEMVSFVPLLSKLYSKNPRDIVFRAHSKGVVRVSGSPKHIMDWVEMLYRTNLDDIDTVHDHMKEYVFTGSCRKFGQFHKGSGKATYSGTFYWFRSRPIFERQWQHVSRQRWGCEFWPGQIADPDETGVLCLDNTGSMYSESYWDQVVRPTYEQWKSEQGISDNADR